jgi:hypothetical protein
MLRYLVQNIVLVVIFSFAVGCSASSPTGDSDASLRLDAAVSNDSRLAAADAAAPDSQSNAILCPEKIYPSIYQAVDSDTFEALRGVTLIKGSLRIVGTEKVTNLSALSCLRSIRDELEIKRNDDLKNLQGLEGLVEIGSSISIADNTSLEDMDGLANLASAGKITPTFRFDVDRNPRLRTINIGKLTVISGGLGIDSNHALVDLGGLRALTSVSRQLWITGNSSLTSLLGTEQLTKVGSGAAPNIGVPVIDLKISGNKSLPQCTATSLLDRLTMNGFKGGSDVSGNLGTCL